MPLAGMRREPDPFLAVARGVLPSEVYAALLAAVAISIAASSIGVRFIRPAVRGGPGAVPTG